MNILHRTLEIVVFGLFWGCAAVLFVLDLGERAVVRTWADRRGRWAIKAAIVALVILIVGTPDDFI
jgi:hypothetical protein